MTHTKTVVLITNQLQKTLTENAFLPNPLKHLNVVTYPAEINCHRKIKLNDAKMQTQSKYKLQTLLDS